MCVTFKEGKKRGFKEDSLLSRRGNEPSKAQLEVVRILCDLTDFEPESRRMMVAIMLSVMIIIIHKQTSVIQIDWMWPASILMD